MTRDELRAGILNGLASLENTFLWMRMTDTQKSVARANAQFWQQAPDADLDKLLTLVQAQPIGEATMKAITFTDAQKTKLTTSGINWQQLLAALKQYGPQVLQIILAILAGQQPAPAKATAPGCCDHHACCYEVLASAMETAALAADHCCQCCEQPPSP